MMPAKTRRRALIGALAVLAAAVVGISVAGLQKNIVYYLDPAELQALGTSGHGAMVRLGGLVQQNSVHWDAKTMALSFDVGVAETGAPSVRVEASGAPPQMFQEGIGAVVEGSFDGRVFRAERVMVKHSNEYRPPAPGERPGDLYGTLEAPLDPRDDAKLRGPRPPLPSTGAPPTVYE